MAPANAEVDGQRNHQADQMNITIKNFVARDWIRLLHPDLTDIVATEYAVELRAGTQLAALVPRIAQNVDSLLKKSTALVNRIDTGKHENEQEHEETCERRENYQKAQIFSFVGKFEGKKRKKKIRN